MQKFQIWLERHSMYILWQNIQLTELPVINSKGKKTQKESTSWNLRWVVTSKNSCVWALVPVTLAVNRLRLSKQLHYAFMKECALPKYAACWLHATVRCLWDSNKHPWLSQLRCSEYASFTIPIFPKLSVYGQAIYFHLLISRSYTKLYNHCWSIEKSWWFWVGLCAGERYLLS